MSRCRFVDANEPERSVERVGRWVRGPQSDPLEACGGRRQACGNEPGGDPASPMVWVYVEVAKTSNRRVVDVGVAIQPAHADDLPLIDSKVENLAWLVEAIRPRVPFLPRPGDERIPLGCGQILQIGDIRARSGDVLSQGIGHLPNRRSNSSMAAVGWPHRAFTTSARFDA